MNNTRNVGSNIPRNLSGDSCKTETEGVAEKTVFTVGYTVVILVSLVGNTLLISTVKRNNRLHTITYRLIINLAAADILVTFCNMPGRLARHITGRYHWFDGIPGIIVCKAASFISDSTVSCSILTLTAIAFERFCLVTFPLRKIVTIKIAKFMVVAIWLASFLSVSPLLYAMSVREINGVIYCYEDWSPLFHQETAAKVYTVIMFVFLYALPLLIICVFYSCVVYKVWIRPVPMACRSNRAVELDARKMSSKCLLLWLWSSHCVGFLYTLHFFFTFFKCMNISAEFPKEDLASGLLGSSSATQHLQSTRVCTWHSTRIFGRDFETYCCHVGTPVLGVAVNNVRKQTVVGRAENN